MTGAQPERVNVLHDSVIMGLVAVVSVAATTLVALFLVLFVFFVLAGVATLTRIPARRRTALQCMSQLANLLRFFPGSFGRRHSDAGDQSQDAA